MDRQEREKIILEQLKRLTSQMAEKQATALCWVMGHMNVVESLLDMEPLTEEREQECIRWALEREDHIMVYILG